MGSQRHLQSCMIHVCGKSIILSACPKCRHTQKGRLPQCTMRSYDEFSASTCMQRECNPQNSLGPWPGDALCKPPPGLPLLPGWASLGFLELVLLPHSEDAPLCKDARNDRNPPSRVTLSSGGKAKRKQRTGPGLSWRTVSYTCPYLSPSDTRDLLDKSSGYEAI